MDLMIIGLAGVTMLLLAVFMSYILGWANRALHVDVDPRIEAINDALPGANCGGCGYVGCMEYAEAIVNEGEDVALCTVGGSSCAQAIAGIMGVDVGQSWPHRPIVHCGASRDQRLRQSPYEGEQTCTAANLVSGVQGCVYGCLGFRDCEAVCSFDAIHIVDGLAKVDYERCTGCAACAAVCPRNIISMVPFKNDRMLAFACSNKDFGKDVRAVCKVGCIGCKACARASDLFAVEDNVARIDYDKYDPETVDQDVEVALDKCPMKGIVYFGPPSAQDQAAVAEEEAPEVAQPQFQTTVDDTEWHG